MPLTISRRADHRQVEGIRADLLARLVEHLSPIAPPCRWIVSDLSLGGWRSHQIALELSAQLDLARPYTADGTSPTARAWQAYLDAATQVGRFGVAAPGADQPTGTHGYADSAGEWVDTEAMGNPTIRRALELAGQLVERLEREPAAIVLVFAPRFGLPWESENEWLMRFMIDGLRDTRHRLYLVTSPDDSPRLPADWKVNWTKLETLPTGGEQLMADGHPTDSRENPALTAGKPPAVAMIPGLLAPETAEHLSTGDEPAGMLSLRSGLRLIPPAWRRPPRKVSRFAHDRLAADLRDVAWLRAYAQYHGNNMHVDPLLLCAEAIRQVEAGGYDLALRLMGRAIDCTRHPEQKGLLQLMAQGWRIAMHRFEEAAALPDPPPSMSDQTRGALLHTKGWAFAMRGEAAAADDYLTRARLVLEALYAERREFLYLLNIHALARVRLGRLDDAMDLERRIERAIAQQEPPDHRLVYINAINLARLHRRRGDLDGAEAYYRRAFATAWGLRSESDAVYGNVCLARLDESRGRYRDALDGWIRAGLHWASATVPEAVGWRVRSAIVSRDRMHDTDSEHVSGSIADMLVQLAGRAGIELPDSADRPSPACVRVRPDGSVPDSIAPARAVGCFVCSVMTTETPIAPAVDGPAWRRLCATLRDLLEVLTRCPSLNEPTLLVDDQFGREMPRDESALTALCVRHGLEHMFWQGHSTRLTSGERGLLEAHSHVRIAVGVEGCVPGHDGPEVRFKRYRRPSPLSDTEADLLRRIDDAPRIVDLTDPPGDDEQLSTLISQLRLLERRHIITIDQT